MGTALLLSALVVTFATASVLQGMATQKRTIVAEPFQADRITPTVFEALSDDPDFEYLIVDSTIVRAHQHASGGKKGGLRIRRSADPAAA